MSAKLIARLRSPHIWSMFVFDDLSEAADTIERQAGLIERLRRYVEHDSSCPVSYAATDDQCLCGLTELLKENTDATSD